MADRPPMYLLVGSQELLLHRAAEDLLAELGGEDLQVTDVRATELGEAGMPDLRTPSLFGTPRAVLVRDAGQLPAGVVDTLLAELAGSPPDAPVVLLATSTGKIQRLAKRLKELGGRIDVNPPREWEDERWADLISQEFVRHGRSADAGAVQAILEHAGTDVPSIVGQVGQVAAASAKGTVTAAQVEALVSGPGSRGSFKVADAMCERRPAEALALLRGALDAGDDPLLVLGALAYRLRSLVGVAAGLDPKEAGLKVSSGQYRRLERVRRNFGPGELTGAYRVLADADLAIKTGELPATLVIEQAVVTIATGEGAAGPR